MATNLDTAPNALPEEGVATLIFTNILALGNNEITLHVNTALGKNRSKTQKNSIREEEIDGKRGTAGARYLV